MDDKINKKLKGKLDNLKRSQRILAEKAIKLSHRTNSNKVAEKLLNSLKNIDLDGEE